MAIAPGASLPVHKFQAIKGGKKFDMSTKEIFAGKTVALFAVPGAFTPTCHRKHLPDFVAHLDEFAASGVDTVACLSVNDSYVMAEWAKASGDGGRMLFLADGSGTFTKAIGLDTDLDKYGMGVRSARYAMLVEDGVVTVLNVEPKSGEATQSGAEALLQSLPASKAKKTG